jgi:hypothetical protein
MTDDIDADDADDDGDDASEHESALLPKSGHSSKR